jgi:hypothetical protein
MPMPTLRKTFGSLAAVALLATGCARQHEPGTTVKSFQASLAFGVKPPATPANFAPGPVTPDALQADAALPEQLTAPFFSTKLRPALGAASAPCPPAGNNAFPKEPAGITVMNPPTAGAYRWKRAGEVTSAKFPVPLPVGGFEQRLIQQVSDVQHTVHPTSNQPGIIFTYQTVQPQIGSTTLVRTTWEVKSDSPQAIDQTPVVEGTPNARAGDPENGIVIKKIEMLDESGNPTGPTFAPVTGLLMLPLPIFQGETFTSTATDPLNGEVAQVQAKVGGKTLVDACGELTEGWEVSGTETFTGEQVETRSFDDVFSLVLGGIVAHEKLSVVDSSGTFNLDLTIGQLSPSKASGS